MREGDFLFESLERTKGSKMPPTNHQTHSSERRSSTANGDHHGPALTAPPLQSQQTTNHQTHSSERRSSTANGDHHGHALTAPPLQRQQTNYPRSSSSSSSASFKGCCCCLFLLFSFLALLVLAVVLVIVLAVKPKKPQFDLQQVGVQYMGISTPNTSSFDGTATAVATTPTTASLSLTIHMLFTAVNPNKVGIRYGESRFTVMYRGIPLGKASVPGFYQEAHSTRNVEATIAVDRANLMQADAADLIRDASLNDRVELRVLGDVGAKIRVLDFDSPGVQVTSFSFFFPFSPLFQLNLLKPISSAPHC